MKARKHAMDDDLAKMSAEARENWTQGHAEGLAAAVGLAAEISSAAALRIGEEAVRRLGDRFLGELRARGLDLAEIGDRAGGVA